MKLVLKPNSGPFKLYLFVPLGWIKWKCIRRALLRQGIDIDLKAVYKELKAAKKKYGHFTLLEAESEDGEKVIIKL